MKKEIGIMSDLIFGIVWTSITTLCFIPFFISLFASKSFSGPSALFVFLFFALFYSIGIWMLTRGIKKIKKDKATEKNGIYTYGKVNTLLEKFWQFDAFPLCLPPIKNHIKLTFFFF